MGRISVLAGTAHDIAHHAVSGLSYISPHLALALREAGLVTAEIELLTSAPYPARASVRPPLQLALAALHSKAAAILEKHGFRESDVASVMLHATPASWDVEGYCLHTRVTIRARSGRLFDSGWLGGT